ncbi:MAG: MBL fold metallo-hydrolase [Kiritimatiellae bacterium]|nr:MBL fold metallo-hydrolase [Kiritimatiellia bacterium]
MKVIFLGTGTSVGIPVIGCNCPVCISNNPKNRRRRTSLYLQAAGLHIVVDTTPDFREQVLQFKIPRVDAVLFTHSHADHIFGFDDIRRFNTIQDSIIPAYADADTTADLKRVFSYIKLEKTPGVYRPRIDFKVINGPFDVNGLHIESFRVIHDPKTTLGFVFESEGRSLGYFPDCHEMPDDIVGKLKGLDVMILDALRHKPHKTHLTVEDSVGLLQRIGAKQSYIIHMCHDLDHDETQKILPEPIKISYDGLTLEW